MKCRFCQSTMFPHQASSYTSETYIYRSWMCLRCPNPVVHHPRDDSYSILCMHRDSCYEFFFQEEENKLFQLLETHSQGECYITYRLIQTLPTDYLITPANASDKLAHILVFL